MQKSIHRCATRRACVRQPFATTTHLRVSADAESRLQAEWDSARWVWNRCIKESKAACTASTCENNIACGPAKLHKDPTRWRNENEWLSARSSVAQRQTILDFGRARQKAHQTPKDRLPIKQRRGMPKFKSRHHCVVSLNYTKKWILPSTTEQTRPPDQQQQTGGTTTDLLAIAPGRRYRRISALVASLAI